MNMKLGPALKIFNIVNMLHGKKHQPLPNWNWERAPHRHFKMDLAVIGRWRNSSLLQNMQDLQNKIILLFLCFVADLPLIYHRRVHPFLDALKSVLKGGGTKNTYIIGSKKKSRYIMHHISDFSNKLRLQLSKCPLLVIIFYCCCSGQIDETKEWYKLSSAIYTFLSQLA